MDDVTLNYLLKRREKLSNFHAVFGKDDIKNIKIHTLSCSFIFNEDDLAGRGTH